MLPTKIIVTKQSNLPIHASPGELAYNLENNKIYIRKSSEWIPIEPIQTKQVNSHPRTCEGCGAVLTSNKCEYCGSEY